MASVVKEPALIPAIAALFKKVEVSPEGASQATRTVIALPPGLARQIEDEFPLFQYDKDTLPPMPPLTVSLIQLLTEQEKTDYF